MKKFIAMVLALVLVVGCLAACGGDKPATTETKGAATTETKAPTSDATGEEAPAALDFGGEKVVMAMMNFSGPGAGLQRVSGLLSDYFTEKANITFELIIMDAASYNQNMTLMLTSGEQVDIFNAITVGYTAVVNKDQVLDLEEDNLIQTYGAGILETMNPLYVDACRIGGKLYGLPQQRDMAAGLCGIAIGTEYLDAIGYDYASMYKEGDEVIYSTYEEVEKIFEQLHEKFPDKYVFAPQEATISQGPLIDAIGGDNFGVLLDPANSLKVEEFFGSQIFYDFCKMFYDWNQAGYISADALTDDTAATSLVKAGSHMSYATATKPGIKQQESNLCGRDMTIFQCGEDFLKSSAVTGMPWCINSNCANPAAAMTVLNILYTDPYAANLLCWGEEGKEWKFAEDGQHITFADGVDAATSEYYNNVNWETPNQFIANIWEGDSLDIWKNMEEFNNNAVASKALGFSFDNSEVAAEYTALTNVFEKYFKSLFYGFANPDETIPQMIAELEEAGLNDYMAAKQAALDEWAAANGVQ